MDGEKSGAVQSREQKAESKGEKRRKVEAGARFAKGWGTNALHAN